MFIGHLPAGYLLSRAIAVRAKNPADASRLLAFGLAGSVLPDIDLAWFYLVDAGQVHHHRCLTHWPLFWLTLALAGFLLLQAARQRKYALPALVLCLNAFVHLLLDTIVGDVWWLAPFVDRPYSLFTVPALYKPWVLNFVLHWSFALELSLAAAAACVYLRRQKTITPLPVDCVSNTR